MQWSALSQVESLKRKQKLYEKQRCEVARLGDNNIDDNTKFLTLTFKENYGY